MIRKPASSITQLQLEIANKSPYSMWRWYQFYPLTAEKLEDGWSATRNFLTACERDSRDDAVRRVNELCQSVLGPWGWQ